MPVSTMTTSAGYRFVLSAFGRRANSVALIQYLAVSTYQLVAVPLRGVSLPHLFGIGRLDDRAMGSLRVYCILKQIYCDINSILQKLTVNSILAKKLTVYSILAKKLTVNSILDPPIRTLIYRLESINGLVCLNLSIDLIDQC